MERTGSKIAMVGVVLSAIISSSALTGEPSKLPQPPKDFLVRAATAIEAVQAKVKDDVILHPLSNAKIKRGEDPTIMSKTPINGVPTYRTDTAKGQFISTSIQTAEAWDGFATKIPRGGAWQVRKHGYLTIGAYDNLPGSLTLCPFAFPQGCCGGDTYLSVPGTSAKVRVETLTSDRMAHRRLVDLVVEEMAKVGITVVRPKDGVSAPPASGPPPKTTVKQPDVAR